MKTEAGRLLRRIAILAVLVSCAVLVTSERHSNTVFAVNYCNYCSSFHSQCTGYCTSEYNACVLIYYEPLCADARTSCNEACNYNQSFCNTNCNTGGGGGGPYPKGSCGGDCYDARGDCLFGPEPPEWIEDCLNGGGNRHTCCNEVFYDCMAGC
jgi:hypothetical protein